MGHFLMRESERLMLKRRSLWENLVAKVANKVMDRPAGVDTGALNSNVSQATPTLCCAIKF